MFGVRLQKKGGTFMEETFKELFKNITNLTQTHRVDRKGKNIMDQKLLKDLIWPIARNDSVIHDSYTCKIKRLKGTDMRPFPTRRLHGKFNFVGSNGGTITLDHDGPCPKECRPSKHKEWVVC